MSQSGEEHFDEEGFRLRGLGMSRIDGFSDVVFGFALTLLVVSLEVPKTYTELHHSLRGVLPFGICFLFLMMVWYSHYKFFRRFGTHDFGTIVINALLLFVILFFVYPLKFLFTFVVTVFSGGGTGAFETYQQLAELMVLYGIAFAAIYLLLAALYWNGYRQREHLQLNPLEVMLARSYVVDNLGVALVGVLSCITALALPAHLSGLAGWVYILISIFKTIHGRMRRKKVARMRSLHEPTNPHPGH